MSRLETRRLVAEPIGADSGPLLAGLLTDKRVAATLGGVPSPDALAGMVARQYGLRGLVLKKFWWYASAG